MDGSIRTTAFSLNCWVFRKAEQVTKSLTQLGIESISLTYSNSADPTARAAQLGSYQRTDGSKGFAADLLLDYAPATSLRA